MNKHELLGNWNEMKGEIKKRWGRLTDDDLMEAHGNYDKLVGKLQQRYGESEENVRRWLDEVK